jgi:hypothetical protein
MQKAIRRLTLVGALLFARVPAQAQQVRSSIDRTSPSSGAFGFDGSMLKPG